MRRIWPLLWLHLIRTTRYLTGAVNWAISDGLWVSIYVFGAIAFTNPSEYAKTIPLVFWAVVAWSLMSLPVWVIGNWVRFYIAMGVYDEHEIAGVEHSVFLALRVIPVLIMTGVSVILVMILIYASTGVSPSASSPPGLLLSLSIILVQATIYGLILAYVSLVIEAPAPLLDFLNFFLFVAGGIAVPIRSLPGVLKIIALLTPYSYPSELMRASILSDYKPYPGLLDDIIASAVYTIILFLLFLFTRKKVMSKARIEGVRGLGRM